MATENPKVIGYIHPNNYRSLKSFKKDRGLKSLSQALDVVLREFFGTADSVEGKQSLERRVTALEAKIEGQASQHSQKAKQPKDSRNPVPSRPLTVVSGKDVQVMITSDVAKLMGCDKSSVTLADRKGRLPYRKNGWIAEPMGKKQGSAALWRVWQDN